MNRLLPSSSPPRLTAAPLRPWRRTPRPAANASASARWTAIGSPIPRPSMLGSATRMSSASTCTAPAWPAPTLAILVVETVGGSDLVCKPIDLDLKVAGTIGLSPCIVKSITKLTPPQIASLPRKLKP
uniref:Uncharacterized protein n=1 Tax=Phenylobacterium glaciei TaxID=2803784 RepID=A0A974P2Y8_9CAUL|nr:hypothetical protein JKL49_23225 [Phenylobacterium glaciei]